MIMALDLKQILRMQSPVLGMRLVRRLSFQPANATTGSTVVVRCSSKHTSDVFILQELRDARFGAASLKGIRKRLEIVGVSFLDFGNVSFGVNAVPVNLGFAQPQVSDFFFSTDKTRNDYNSIMGIIIVIRFIGNADSFVTRLLAIR
jgi:hypothetical protein